MKMRILLPALLLNVAIAQPINAEGTVAPIEKLVSELAEKPEHHKAISNYYTEKAAAARAEAAEHQKMASMRIGHSKSAMTQQNWESHCKSLSSSLESVAKEYDALAKLHEEKGN